ncbi:helix-turn-helix domain-containing protein [Microbacterium timonense]|uniref:DNA-binding protein n=1 Tax=Microbacterium timonense TaxID=2086576 RepID=UPI000D0F536A|nr:DNA-binding protein [Microbacterium timonense]
MYVVTADQRASRVHADAVPAAIAVVARHDPPRLALAPERTAGDEIQAAIADAATVLAVILDLTRTGQWSVGVGVGAVESPLPASVRAARGEAFVNARDAVERAKKASTRMAVTAPADGDDAEALVRLLIELRDRRTAEGWEVYDLLAEGLTQRDAADRLGISEGAVSLRAKTAALRTEEAAIPALQRVLERLDAPAAPGEVSHA